MNKKLLKTLWILGGISASTTFYLLAPAAIVVNVAAFFCLATVVILSAFVYDTYSAVREMKGGITCYHFGENPYFAIGKTPAKASEIADLDETGWNNIQVACINIAILIGAFFTVPVQAAGIAVSIILTGYIGAVADISFDHDGNFRFEDSSKLLQTMAFLPINNFSFLSKNTLGFQF